MKDLLIGAISKLAVNDVKPWYKSARQSEFKGDIILLAYDEPEAILKEFMADGIFVIQPIHNHLNIPLVTYELNRQRFFDIWLALTQYESVYRYVISTDVRDVVFQSNPSVWLEDNIGEYDIVAGSECCKYADEPWNKKDMLSNFGPFIYEYLMKDKLVTCCGVQAGTSTAIKNLSLLIYLTAKNCYEAGDQAAINILFNTVVKAKITTFNDGFVCHCAIPFEPSRANLKKYLTDAEPVWKDGILYTNDDKQFVIVHQYNRISELNTIITERYA